MQPARDLARELWAACPKMAVKDASAAELGRPSPQTAGPGAARMRLHFYNLFVTSAGWNWGEVLEL